MSSSRLAFLAANPRDFHTPLRQLEEVSRLRAALDSSRLRGRITIDQYLTARPEDLKTLLANPPEVLYFSGFESSPQGGISLEDERGYRVALSSADLDRLFARAKARLRLLFVTTCYSDATARALLPHCDVAIGFAGLLADDFGNAYAENLFRSLFDGKPVAAACEAADAAAQEAAGHVQRLVGAPDCARIVWSAATDRGTHAAFTARPLSVFISYGGPDQAVAERLDKSLRERGVATFLFANDAKSGQPLHRVMHEGVRDHDWVLLLCSQNSLTRPGVLNEIEETLNRKARQGGRSALVPIAIDDYVYSEWSPDRTYLATQVRSLVIGDFRKALKSRSRFDAAVNRLVADLIGPQ